MPTFPYDLQEASELKGIDFIKSTTFGNEFLIDMVKASIENEKLGLGEATDFLSVSFSSTDYIWHALAYSSVEVQNYLSEIRSRFGRSTFLFLYKKVWKGEYLVFLTADYAAVDNLSYLKDLRCDAETLFNNSLFKTFRDFP